MIKLQVMYDKDDRIYDHHFPGMPVVPGTLILETICKIMKSNNLIFERVRFKKFMKPEQYEFEISENDSIYKFKVKKETIVYATGTFRKST